MLIIDKRNQGKLSQDKRTAIKEHISQITKFKSVE